MSLAREDEFRGTERFAVQRRLGAGAFGVVYQALDRERGTLVALKTLREASVEALFRLKREFRALADISHPNLVTLHELLTHRDQWFFTMELVEGVNFLQFVRGELEAAPAAADDPTSPALSQSEMLRREPVSRHPGRPDRIRAALRQAVAGIQALHHAGQLHRDIKPSNVLVTRDGRVVLLDFGLVTDLAAKGSQRSLSIVGTPAYMSPEQGSALAVAEPSDWYSLGVMLFEALTGRWPFGGGFVEMMWEKRNSDAPAPRDLAQSTPEDLNALCRDLLARDSSARPTGEQILSRLGGIQSATYEPDAGRVAPVRAPAFVGRESHLAVLREAFEATKDGRAMVVRLHGASGSGKTALARRFLAEVQAGEAVVLSGRCYERESVPYKALDSLVDALSQFLKRLPPAEVSEILPRDVLALSRLFPVLRRVESIAGARRRVLEIPDSQELRRRAFAALRELLGRLADQRNVILFIDDLQWGDVDSAALLSELLRPPDPPPLLLIACYRSEDAKTSPFLRSLLAAVSDGESVTARELAVGELTVEEARDLTRSLLKTESLESEAQAEGIARESGGNPFFIAELVRYTEAGVDAAELPEHAPGPAARRPTLEDVVRARVDGLPEPARRLLEILSVAGQPLSAEVAAQAAGLAEQDAGSLALLRTRHLVRTRTTQERNEVEPYHDRIRETVVASLPPGTLRTHHKRLALALEAFGRSDPETLALHFQEAGETDRAAEYAVAAAGQASEALAFFRAARLYRLALELMPLRVSERRDLSVKLGDALSNAGHSAEAAEAYLSAVDGAPAADALELRRRAAEQFLISGHIEKGLAALRPVLARVGVRLAATHRGALASMLIRRMIVRLRGIRFRERDPTQISAEKLTRIDVCWSAAKGLSLADPIRGNDFQARHLLLALRAGEPYRIARALAVEAGHSASDGGRTRRRTEKLFEAATSLADRIGHPHAIGFTMSVAGVAAYLEGRWKAAHQLTERAGALLQESCRGVAWELDNAHYYSLMSLLYLGELKELFRALPELLKEAQDRGDLFHVTNTRTRLSYVARLASDQPQHAREELGEAISMWPHGDFFVQNWYELVGQTETRLYEDAGPETWRYLETRWPALKRSFLLRVQSVLINSLFLRARCAVGAAANGEQGGDRRELLKIASRIASRIDRERMPWGKGLARLIRAGVASVIGDEDETVAQLEQAERELRSCDMALHAAIARRRLGELLGGDQGRAAVESCDAWMRGQDVKNPAKLSAMLAPGRW